MPKNHTYIRFIYLYFASNDVWHVDCMERLLGVL